MPTVLEVRRDAFRARLRPMARVLPLIVLVAACARQPEGLGPHAADPFTGSFIDDYGATYEITATRWTRLPGEHHEIQGWNVSRGYLVARNDPANEYAAGRWTRIDFVLLPQGAPYEWGYCLSAYDAPTKAAAESTSTARRAEPMTGCNGYPFTRMRRVVP